VGHFLEVAARQTNDYETLARTLIEDLGNTIMGLGEVNQGISYIQQGIRVAEDHGLHFLVARGYRNLANCYSYKGASAKARAALVNASAASQSIGSAREKLEVRGAITYAESKLAFTDGKFQDAITKLDEAVQIYSDLAQQFPETMNANKDRLVKIHREKGVICLKTGEPDAQDRAYASCQTGLQLAQATQNYDNIVRCCCIMATILLNKDAVPAAEGMMNIAANNVSKIDTPAIIEEYNHVNRRLIIARQATS
jgi:tetratricopeptide (TPR) repeat protein